MTLLSNSNKRSSTNCFVEKRKRKKVCENVHKDVQYCDVLKREIKRGTQVILQSMKKTLKAYPNIVTQEIVMRKVMANPIVTTFVENHDMFSKDAIIEREFMIGLVQSLSKVRRPYTLAQLATKHAFFTIVVNGNSKTSFKQKVRLLNVHPKNVAMAIQCRELMRSSRDFLWSLII
jgi:hypothetical protein